MENSCEMANTKHQKKRGAQNLVNLDESSSSQVFKVFKVLSVIFVEISVRPGAAISATKAPTARCLRELKIDKSEVDALGTRL